MKVLDIEVYNKLVEQKSKGDTTHLSVPKEVVSTEIQNKLATPDIDILELFVKTVNSLKKTKKPIKKTKSSKKKKWMKR